MKTVQLLVAAALLASAVGVTRRADAQAYDKAYAKSLILTGGTSTANTYTIKAPTMSSPLTFTWPATITIPSGILFNNGSGTLTWPATISNPTQLAPGGTNTFLITNGSGTVAWNALAVDGTTLTGNGVSTSLGINLAQSNTWTAAPTVLKTAIGTTPTDAIVLSNTTAAAAGAQQYSPRLRLTGQGWATTPAASQEVDWMLQSVPVQGAANPTSYLDFESGLSNAGYTNRFALFSSGGATLGIASPTDPGAGVLNLGTGLQINGGAPVGSLLISDGMEFVASTLVYPAPGTAGNVIRSNGSNFISTAPNTAQYSIATAYTTGSGNAGEMMGLASGSPAATFTPTYSGKILIIVTGNMYNSATGTGTVQLHWGTGTAPAASGAAAGTATGTLVTETSQNVDNQWFFSLSGIVTGLVLSTPIWIDVETSASAGTTTTIDDVAVTVEEF